MIKKVISEYQKLFRNIPALIPTFFVMSVVLMNVLANRILFQWNDMVAADAGFLLSWIPFLCMDMTTKHFGPKASIMLNVFAVAVNLCMVGIFTLAVMSPGNGQDFSGFDSTFGSCWFIVVGSMTAFVASGIFNSLSNHFIGKLFKKNEDSFISYITRTWVSTFFGQWLDNFIFAGIVFGICAPIFWGWGYSFIMCVGTGCAGALLELVMEAVFSPLGFKVCQKWKKNNIGAEWLEAHC